VRHRQKGRLMTSTEYKHLRVRNVDDVFVVEVTSDNVQGPERAQEFSSELASVVCQEASCPLLVDLSRARYFSSMALSALFKLVKLAKERLRPIRFCKMHPDVRVVAEIAGLPLVVEIHDTDEAAIAAFARA
jgi:anti-anti-sigma factor